MSDNNCNFLPRHVSQLLLPHDAALCIQLLRPAAKKLTVIDARRVMSIYEDTVRRVQLVAGLLEQTSIRAIIGRLHTTLGVELVEALLRYATVAITTSIAGHLHLRAICVI